MALFNQNHITDDRYPLFPMLVFRHKDIITAQLDMYAPSDRKRFGDLTKVLKSVGVPVSKEFDYIGDGVDDGEPITVCGYLLDFKGR